MTRQRAWAVWDNTYQCFLIRTVSETVVSAKVNWLCSVAGFVAPADMTEEVISVAFHNWVVAMGADVAVVEVEISFPETGGLMQ